MGYFRALSIPLPQGTPTEGASSINVANVDDAMLYFKGEGGIWVLQVFVPEEAAGRAKKTKKHERSA